MQTTIFFLHVRQALEMQLLAAMNLQNVLVKPCSRPEGTGLAVQGPEFVQLGLKREGMSPLHLELLLSSSQLLQRVNQLAIVQPSRLHIRAETA